MVSTVFLHHPLKHREGFLVSRSAGTNEWGPFWLRRGDLYMQPILVLMAVR